MTEIGPLELEPNLTKRPKVAIIIPAYNEAGRIQRVLDAAVRTRLHDELIVVSDASTDDTASIARSFPTVRVIELVKNLGKGGAMAAGVRATDADVLVFIDADLLGLQPEHIERIVIPLLAGSCDMCLGVFRGGSFWSDTGQRVFPYISGQRAMKRWLFEAIPCPEDMRMGIEITIHAIARRYRARVQRVPLLGVSNTFKERKMGFVRGTKARTQMYAEIARAVVRTRKRDRVANRLFR